MTESHADSVPTREPQVTICMPAFNRVDLIGETLDSIIAQNFHAWEAIVVDDGSTDGTGAVVAEYSRRDPRIRLLARTREPKGACTCRNLAVEAARGSYVMFLDTDDVLAPFCLEQRVKAMSDDVTLDFAVFGMFVFRGPTPFADRLWNVETAEEDLVRVLHLDPVCQGTGTLWKRSSFIDVGMWNERLAMWQDIDLHLRAFAPGMSYAKRLDLPPDVFLRETEGSLSRGSYHSREKVESREAVVRSAIALLNDNHRRDLVPETRFMCAGVVLDWVTLEQHDRAKKMRKWGENEGVFSAAEVRALTVASIAIRARFDRLPLARALRDRFLASLRAPGSLGSTRA